MHVGELASSSLGLTEGRPRSGAVGYAPGAFDMFHMGHLNMLRRARLACDYLIAEVVSDEVAERQKGRRPVVPERARIMIVQAIRFVDEVHLETTTDELATWEMVRFDVVFKGDDWRGSSKWTHLEDRFQQLGVDVQYVPYTDHVSSSHLRRAAPPHALARHNPSGLGDDRIS